MSLVWVMCQRACSVRSCLVARKGGIAKDALTSIRLIPEDVGEAHSERRDLTRIILDPMK